MTMAEVLPSNYSHTLLVDFATFFVVGLSINEKK